MKKFVFALTIAIAAVGLTSFAPAVSFMEDVTYKVATDKSKVEWIAAKKKGYHPGHFLLKSGELVLDGTKLKGGKFVIDLASLKVNDGAGERLENHLKSKDFFDIEAKGSEAVFTVNAVNYTSEKTADVAGTLAIKGLTVPVRFPVQIRSVDANGFFGQAFFTLDRSLLQFAFGGDVSNDVQIAVHLFATK